MLQLLAGSSWSAWLSACFILGAAGEILVIEPSRLVVEYGAKASANCSTTYRHQGIGWEASQAPVEMQRDVQLITWTVPSLIHWDIKPLCYINLENGSQIDKELLVTLYKLPDGVFISSVTCSGPVTEGQSCLLSCGIQNVAPVHYLHVTFYKYQSEIQNASFTESSITPVDRYVNHTIKLSRNDDGAKYWCETKLALGAEGPQPPPTMKSEPLRITVHYKPVFANDTVIMKGGGEEITLNCTTRANPASRYTWKTPHPDEPATASTPTISVSQEGNYTCTASNQYGTATKRFIVIQPKSRTTFWTILVIGLVVAALLLIPVGLIVYRKITSRGPSANNSKTPSPAGQKEEGEELVATRK